MTAAAAFPWGMCPKFSMVNIPIGTKRFFCFFLMYTAGALSVSIVRLGAVELFIVVQFRLHAVWQHLPLTANQATNELCLMMA